MRDQWIETQVFCTRCISGVLIMREPRKRSKKIYCDRKMTKLSGGVLRYFGSVQNYLYIEGNLKIIL